MLCGLEKLIPQKGTFEILGCDLMLDSELNPYLIEINLTPSLDCSTKV